MKNRKNSHSLSKLHLKRNEYQGNSQRSLLTKYSKRSNHSNIQRFGTETPIERDHNQAVRNQYYGTVQDGIYRSQHQSLIQRKPKKMRMGSMMHQIEQKMKRVLQSQQFDSQIYIRNVVLEQQDVDQDFEEKILENKHLLKQQRQKHDFNHSQYKHQQSTQLNKKSKKFKKMSLIQGKNQKISEKLKSKSLLPIINPVTSKLLDLNQQKSKQNQHKNFTQRKNIKLQNIYLLPNLRHKNSQNELNINNDHKSVQSRLMIKNSVDINANVHVQKNLAEFHKNLSNKKSTQLKLQSKIQQLKTKIAQRTNKQHKNKLNQNIQNISQNKIVKRYSSHSVFDGIQQFLSNPHQNNSKSQRKFMKLYQKISDNDVVIQKEKQTLKKKIQIIQNKINHIEQNPSQIIQQQIYNTKKDKIQIPTSAGSSPTQKIDDENGSIIWRRLQGNKIQKSNFDNEIKYVKSLEEKGRQNLANYIENQKILHELKMIRKTQQILHKNERKMKSQAHQQKHIVIQT